MSGNGEAGAVQADESDRQGTRGDVGVDPWDGRGAGRGRPAGQALAAGRTAPASPAARASLSAVSCKGSSWCLAVGSYTTRSRRRFSLAEAWNGPTWKILRPPDGADVVIDPVGGDLAEPALRALRWGGRFVTVGYASGTIPRIPLNLVLLKGATIAGFQFRDFAANAPGELARNESELFGLLASRKALPHIGATFALAEAAAALRHVADRKAIGKVVIDVS